jgi:5-methylcytosine-specific restriction endonuclease McrA
MGRPFDFHRPTQQSARLRQGGRCAHCGERLDDLWEHAHHVIPNQVGRVANPADDFLRSEDNCVVLCEPCHEAAHAFGQYQHGAVALAEWFPYSHNRRSSKAHEKWASSVDTEWERRAPR